MGISKDGAEEPEIVILEERLINQIAAGEVVERPASVVKELIENSVDAGASKIEIMIKEGGVKEIKVIDNGHGMSRENAKIAFERHSTSKIRSLEDLMMIGTFGFRGEALASIAAVSKVEMKTRRSGTNIGTVIRIEGGKIKEIDDVGCAVGTTIDVEDLFYNVPVRKKYLKSISTELGHIMEIVTLMTFANPEVSFKLVNNGREVLNVPGVNNLLENITRIYGREVADRMVEVSGGADWIRINGYISNLEETRASKYYITVIVNRRVIKSPIITNAILDAYRGLLMKGRYPIVVLRLEIDPREVDVNVHPMKKEIRFSRENEIYDIVEIAVKDALSKIKTVMKIDVKEFKEKKLDLGMNKEVGEKMDESRSIGEVMERKYSERKSRLSLKDERRNLIQKKVFESIEGISSKGMKEEDYIGEKGEIEAIEEVGMVGRVEMSKTGKLPWMKYVGQIFRTYLVAEDQDNFYLIDQHAAHERVRLEELKRIEKGRKVKIQKLLKPIKMELIPGEEIEMKDVIEMLNGYGFEIEHFGGATYIMKGVPVIIGKMISIGEVKDLVEEIIHMKGKLSIKEMKDRVMNMIACRSAIKANEEITDDRARRLIKELDRCENPFSCCHGRPTIISFSKKDIEKKFKRV